MRLFFALFQYIYESQKYISEPKEKLTVPTDLIPELSVVTLTHPVEHGARELPRGTKGTIVFAYEGGQHYEVEFFEPFPCVVTVARADNSAQMSPICGATSGVRQCCRGGRQDYRLFIE